MKKLLFLLSLLFISFSSFSQTLDLDPNLKADMIAFGVDTNGDGEIQSIEAEQIDSLVIGQSAGDIQNLSSLEYFVNLRYLSIWSADQVDIDISSLQKLEHFGSFQWAVRNIVADNMPNLKTFSSSFGVSSISLNGTENLERFGSSDNFGLIHDLEYSKWTKLKNLTLSGLAGFKELNLNGCISLENLFIHFIGYAGIFEALTIKNGRHTDITMYDHRYESSFQYICTDDDEVDYINGILREQENNGIEVNTYCSFEGGGLLKKITGRNHIDLDGDGCDENDPSMPRLKYEITKNNTGESDYRHASDGSYTFKEIPGSYRITPHIENQEYYKITPAYSDVSITDSESEAYLDFCIEKIGEKHDVLVSLYSTTAPRPGFAPIYWLSFDNVGNNTVSGDINLKFDNEHLKFLWSDVEAESLDHGEMIWNFDNLLPNENRQIRIQFELNRPTHDEFPLMGGEKLHFELNINPEGQDDNLDNNEFKLVQEVVNSYDPNDITCLEGDSIFFMETGEYVHYLVRFENTGSASAVNIVVKDTIDGNQFDLSSFIPMKGSHEYKTKLTDDGIVEFIFENVNLPHEGEQKHGHVLFKIKTKESLVEGDHFTNKAAIYFDYNFPIHTNEYETQVVGLAAVLPVRLSSFDAIQSDADVDLNWIVQSEENLSHYIVERKHEYEDYFYEVAKVNASNLSRYETTDKSAKESGANYYRLRIVDNDGSSDLSDVIAISYKSKSDANIMIYPNPATEIVVVENNHSTSQTFSILNSAGKEVMSINVGAHSKREIGLSAFNKGLHFVSYLVGDKLEVKKIIIN